MLHFPPLIRVRHPHPPPPLVQSLNWLKHLKLQLPVLAPWWYCQAVYQEWHVMKVFMSESSTVCCPVYGPGSRGVGLKGELSIEVSPRMCLSEVGTQDLAELVQCEDTHPLHHSHTRNSWGRTTSEGSSAMELRTERMSAHSLTTIQMPCT